jgi:hypothetical protein
MTLRHPCATPRHPSDNPLKSLRHPERATLCATPRHPSDNPLFLLCATPRHPVRRATPPYPPGVRVYAHARGPGHLGVCPALARTA